MSIYTSDEKNPGYSPLSHLNWLDLRRDAEVFSEVAHAGEFGVIASPPVLDWAAALARKNSIVSRLHGGLTGLMKQRKVDVFEGSGRIAAAGVVLRHLSGFKRGDL